MRCILAFVFLIGRVLFSLIFILKSFEHFSPHMIEYAASMGVLLAPFTVPFAGLISLAGGLSMLLGYRAKMGAWLLVIFLLPSAFIMHQFWNASNAFAVMMQQYCFWKNLSMLGAALMITHFGSGPYSLSRK